MRHLGKVEPVPGGLIAAGPLVNVTLSHDSVTLQALIATGKPAHQVIAPLMIDTGAQLTCVDVAIAQELGLRAMRFMPVTGVSGIAEEYPVYRMGITIGMSDAMGTEAKVCYSADVVGMPSPTQSALHRGLLGRDFLRHFKLVYDGSLGEFELRLAVALTGTAVSQSPPVARSHGVGRTAPDRKNRRKRERQARRRNR